MFLGYRKKITVIMRWKKYLDNVYIMTNTNNVRTKENRNTAKVTIYYWEVLQQKKSTTRRYLSLNL